MNLPSNCHCTADVLFKLPALVRLFRPDGQHEGAAGRSQHAADLVDADAILHVKAPFSGSSAEKSSPLLIVGSGAFAEAVTAKHDGGAVLQDALKKTPELATMRMPTEGQIHVMIDIGIKPLRSMGKLNRKTGIVHSKLRKLLIDHRSITCQIVCTEAGIIDAHNGNAFPESTWWQLWTTPSLPDNLRSAGACKHFCA